MLNIINVVRLVRSSGYNSLKFLEAQSLNLYLYVQQLERVQISLARNCPALVNRKNILLYRNANLHAVRITNETIWENGRLFQLSIFVWLFTNRLTIFSIIAERFDGKNSVMKTRFKLKAFSIEVYSKDIGKFKFNLGTKYNVIIYGSWKYN